MISKNTDGIKIDTHGNHQDADIGWRYKLSNECLYTLQTAQLCFITSICRTLQCQLPSF